MSEHAAPTAEPDPAEHPHARIWAAVIAALCLASYLISRFV